MPTRLFSRTNRLSTRTAHSVAQSLPRFKVIGSFDVSISDCFEPWCDTNMCAHASLCVWVCVYVRRRDQLLLNIGNQKRVFLGFWKNGFWMDWWRTDRPTLPTYKWTFVSFFQVIRAQELPDLVPEGISCTLDQTWFSHMIIFASLKQLCTFLTNLFFLFRCVLASL